MTRRIWGWMFFDWASQPFATLLLTFVLAPYIAEVLGDGSRAQALWGLGVGAAGILIALLAPLLGAVAETTGGRIRFIQVFSALYVIGAAGTWLADPAGFSVPLVLAFFALGLIGMEFTTIFTNAMLPDLGTREEIGRISGNGWAFGYLGGLTALVIMLVFFAESAATGRTFAGLEPALGLDAGAREGTRFVGPFTALWYLVFMVPFFLLVRDPRPVAAPPGALRRAMGGLMTTLRSLPGRPSLFAYLASSMFYRDALNGIYTFGAIYAAGVLGWSAVDTGIFGILAIVTGAVAAWAGGRADSALGPKPVIVGSILTLMAVTVVIIFVSRDAVFGVAVPEGGRLPDLIFYAVGAVIGAAGGSLQTASRSMMVRQGDPARMTEGFGLYALAGKATSFVAPLSVAGVTALTGSQQAGVLPLIALFGVGLFLLLWVKPNGDRAEP